MCLYLVGLRLGLELGIASQASHVYLPRMAIHTATGEASHVYSISLALMVSYVIDL